MIKKRLAAIVLIATLLISMVAAPAVHAQPVMSWQMGICLDGSGSISSSEWSIMLNGLADAVGDANIVPQDGSVEITVVQFAGGITGGARVEIVPTMVTAASVGGLVTAIQNIPQGGGRTPMNAGIDLILKKMKFEADGVTVRSQWTDASWHVINISTDGVPNEPGASEATGKAAAVASRNAAAAAGIDEMDAEGIGFEEADLEWMAGQAGSNGIVIPTPAWIVGDGDPYPPRPPDASFTSFVRACGDFEDYADAIAEKFLILRTLTLEPPTATNPLRSDHTVTARLTRLGIPMAGETIDFEVIAGPNMGKTGQGITDDDGYCTWTYPDTAAADGDVDTIRCSNSYADHVVYSNTVDKTWEAVPANLELQPSGTNPVRTSHTVTATLTDANGDPISGAMIHFEVIAGPNIGKSGDVMTNGGGKCQWTYTDDSANPGDVDTIQASHAFDGVVLSNTVTKTWVAKPTGIPAMSDWAAAIAVTCLALVATFQLRRRAGCIPA